MFASFSSFSEEHLSEILGGLSVKESQEQPRRCVYHIIMFKNIGKENVFHFTRTRKFKGKEMNNWFSGMPESELCLLFFSEERGMALFRKIWKKCFRTGYRYSETVLLQIGGFQ